jgi:hypothetical protein
MKIYALYSLDNGKPMQIFKQSLVEDGKFILYQMNIITRFVTRATRRVPLVDQELLTLPELTPVFNGVCIDRMVLFSSEIT